MGDKDKETRRHLLDVQESDGRRLDYNDYGEKKKPKDGYAVKQLIDAFVPSSKCPNGCSGHGFCAHPSRCECYRVEILSQLGQDPTALFARARKGPRGPLSRPLPTRRIRRWNAQMRALV